jgi:hypothetical protein
MLLVEAVGGVRNVARLRPEREVLHLPLEVVRAEVAVEVGRRARILVPHDPLHRREIGTAHEEQRGRRVPKVVETDPSNLAHGEELELAPRAPTLGRVRSRLLVPAPRPPAFVDVARHYAGPRHRASEHVLELPMPRPHLPLRVGEDQRRGRFRDGLPEVREQLAVDRDRLDAPALRDVALVRAANHDEPGREIHVRLLQREELALAHAGVDRRGEQPLPLGPKRSENRRDLVRSQVVRQPLDDLPLRHVRGRVWPREPLHSPRHRERAAEVPAQVVHAPRAQDLLLPREEEIDLAGRHFDEPELAEGRADDVLPDARLASRGGRSVEELVDPPLHHRVDGAATIRQVERLEAEALPLVPLLPIRGETPSLGLRARLGGLADPVAASVENPQIPGVALEVNRGHG